MIIIYILLMFSTLKFGQLWKRSNPNMNSYEREFEESPVVNLNDKRFRIAFAVEDVYAPYALKNDPNYVKWFFEILRNDGEVSSTQMLDAHLCTE